MKKLKIKKKSISYCDLERKAAEKLQDLFGYELLSLDDCRKLRDKFEVDIENIQKQLFEDEVSIDFVSGNIALRRIQQLTKQTERVACEVDSYVHEVSVVKEELDKYILQINTINLLSEYIKVVRYIESFGDELHKHLGNNNKEPVSITINEKRTIYPAIDVD